MTRIISAAPGRDIDAEAARRRATGGPVWRRFAASRLALTQFGLLALFWVAVAVILPVTRLEAGPLMHVDYSYHYSQVMEVNELLRDQGRIWGYSTQFAAGTLVGLGSNASSRAWALFVYLLSHLSVPAVAAFNLYPILTLACTPILIYLACRRFALPPLDSTLATVIAMIYWSTSELYWYFYHGVVSFLASVPLGLFAIASLYAFTRERRGRQLVAFALAGALCGWVHPLSAVFIVPGCAAVYLTGFRRLSPAQHVAVLAMGTMALAAQWPWLAPTLATRHWLPGSPEHAQYFQPEGLTSWAGRSVNRLLRARYAGVACLIGAAMAAFLWRRDRFIAALFLAGPPLLLAAAMLITTPLHRILLLAGLAGLVVWWRSGRRALAIACAVVPVVLIGLGYGGSAFSSLQPGRNIPVAYFWLALPTAAFFEWLSRYWREHGLHRAMLGVAAGLLVLSLWPFVEPSIAERFATQPVVAVQAASTDMNRLIEWLGTNTTTDGRVLYEESAVLLFAHNASAGYLAHASGRSFIGGPYPWGGPVDYIAGYPFGRPVASITGSEMARLLDLYNIHWVIVHTEASRAYFDAHPELVERVDDMGVVRAYRVRQPATFFLAGKGEIAVRGHDLELSHLEGSTVVIKYHWVPGLKATSGVRLERADASPDPFGFIKIVAPPDHLTIHLVASGDVATGR